MVSPLYPNPPLDLIRERIRLDPEAGMLYWTCSIGRYIKAGAPILGTYAKRSKVPLVSVSGHKVPAPQIAWFLHHGHWPRRPVTAKDKRPFNLTPGNLILTDPPPLKNTPEAEASRKYQKRRREARWKQLEHENPHIMRNPAGEWIVKDPEHFQKELALPNREFGPFRSFGLALRFSEQHEDRMRDIMSDDPKIEDEEAYTATAGPDGARLVDFEIAFWLDPKTGHFYHRRRTGIYATRADYPAERGRYLQLQSRRYPAHNVVWFMNYAEWPDRKAIRHKNGNPNDNRLDNLELRIRK